MLSNPEIAGAPASTDACLCAQFVTALNVSGVSISVGGIFSFPMVLGTAVVGVVDLSTTSPRAADADFVSTAQTMASDVALAAVERALHAAQQHRSPESDRSPALRREVHQATGIVISQLGISAPDAFARLQAHAFSTGRPIDDVSMTSRNQNCAQAQSLSTSLLSAQASTPRSICAARLPTRMITPQRSSSCRKARWTLRRLSQVGFTSTNSLTRAS